MKAKAVTNMFRQLLKQPKVNFPKARETLIAPKDFHGVYIIRNSKGRVEHVGRTVRGKKRLYQRLKNHLQGSSSFVKNHLDGKGVSLRNGYTYQYHIVEDEYKCAVLEHYATGCLCPLYLALGVSSKPKKTSRTKRRNLE